MKASNWSQASHRKFHHYVMVELPKVMAVPVIVQAMQRHGFLNKRDFGWALTEARPPLLHLVSGLVDKTGRQCFGFTPETPPAKLPNGVMPPVNSILIEKALADEFETPTGGRLANTSADQATNRKVLKAGATILHELCHWGDWQAHGKFTDTGLGHEHGGDFEAEVYGAIL